MSLAHGNAFVAGSAGPAHALKDEPILKRISNSLEVALQESQRTQLRLLNLADSVLGSRPETCNEGSQDKEVPQGVLGAIQSMLAQLHVNHGMIEAHLRRLETIA